MAVTVKPAKPTLALPPEAQAAIARGWRDVQMGRKTSDALRARAHWIGEWKKVTDPVDGWDYFAENYLYIPTTGGWETADLWEEQKGVIVPALGSTDNIISAKSRQWGVTTAVKGRFLWKAGIDASSPGYRGGAFNVSLREAREFIRDIKFMASKLPPYFKQQGAMPGPSRELRWDDDPEGRNSAEVVDWGSRGSTVMAIPCSAGGRGLFFDDAFLDEFGKYENAEELYATVRATVLIRGGRLIIISQGNGRVGRGKKLYELVTDALQGQLGPDWREFFLSAVTHPVYGGKLDELRKEFKGGERRFRMEFPTAREDCFLGYSEGAAYDLDHLAATVRLGKQWDEAVEAGDWTLRPEWLELSIDWGVNGCGLATWHMPGGRKYTSFEFPKPPRVDARRWSEDFVNAVFVKYPFLQHWNWPDPLWCWYDTGGPGAVAQDSFVAVWGPAGAGISHSHGVNFGHQERAGMASDKERNAEYARELMRRTHEGEETHVWGISPTCTLTVESIEAREVGVDGRIKKAGAKDVPDHPHDTALVGLQGARKEWERAQA